MSSLQCEEATVRLTGGERLHLAVVGGRQALVYLLQHALAMILVLERRAERKTTQHHRVHYDSAAASTATPPPPPQTQLTANQSINQLHDRSDRCVQQPYFRP